jgi:lysophospholipase L1-like esterase
LSDRGRAGGESRLAGLLKNLALAALACAVVVVLAEVGLQLAAPIPISMQVDHLPDGYMRVRLHPDRVYRLASGGTCTINGQGYRHRGRIAVPKPAGCVRVVALGGSSTFSYHTGDEAIWTQVLEDSLRSRYGDGVEVVNAGVPGYSIVESTINYMTRVRHLVPDVVVVYHTWNDMKFFLSIEAGRYPGGGVYHRSRLKKFLRRFQLVQRVRILYNTTLREQRRENSFAVPDSTVRIAPDGPAHRWERRNFIDLARLVQVDGACVVFSTEAGLLNERTVDDPAVRRKAFVEYVGMPYRDVVTQWNAVDSLMADAAALTGATFIDVRAQVPSTLDDFIDHVHLTRQGNALVGRALFEAMTRSATLDSLFLTAHP